MNLLPEWRRKRKAGNLVLTNLPRRKQIGKKEWQRRQAKDELPFWKDPSKFEELGKYKSVREKYFDINKNMFHALKLSFPRGTVVDIGCGAELGFLPFLKAANRIGVDPLASQYRAAGYKFDAGIKMIDAPAEQIPLSDESVDALYCVNALDHMMRPYKGLDEMYRILKPGGYFALSVDIGGTPEHPVRIEKKDLDSWFAQHNFEVIEQRCSKDIISSWPPEMQIPLYVFQGVKKQ